jgi:hypothetical protein
MFRQDVGKPEGGSFRQDQVKLRNPNDKVALKVLSKEKTHTMRTHTEWSLEKSRKFQDL